LKVLDTATDDELLADPMLEFGAGNKVNVQGRSILLLQGEHIGPESNPPDTLPELSRP
jgi:hypothetical protein